MMLRAIYAWRRKRASPRSERSDAIMDLRAGSRNSNSILVPISFANPRPLTLSLHQPPPPCPGSRFMCARSNRSPFSKEAREVHYLVRCTLQTTIRPREDRNPSCPNLLPPEQAPDGVLLTTGSVAQSPGACHVRACLESCFLVA